MFEIMSGLEQKKSKLQKQNEDKLRRSEARRVEKINTKGLKRVLFEESTDIIPVIDSPKWYCLKVLVDQSNCFLCLNWMLGIR